MSHQILLLSIPAAAAPIAVLPPDPAALAFKASRKITAGPNAALLQSTGAAMLPKKSQQRCHRPLHESTGHGEPSRDVLWRSSSQQQAQGPSGSTSVACGVIPESVEEEPRRSPAAADRARVELWERPSCFQHFSSPVLKVSLPDLADFWATFAQMQISVWFAGQQITRLMTSSE